MSSAAIARRAVGRDVDRGRRGTRAATGRCRRRRCHARRRPCRCTGPARGPRRSACTVTVSPSQRRISGSCIDTMSSEPSGSQPRPEGSRPGNATTVSSVPSSVTVCTASPCMSENQSRSSRQRGPSPNTRPSVSRRGAAVTAGPYRSRCRFWTCTPLSTRLGPCSRPTNATAYARGSPLNSPTQIASRSVRPSGSRPATPRRRSRCDVSWRDADGEHRREHRAAPSPRTARPARAL